MNEFRPTTTSYEWLRAYTALSRSGLVTDRIRTCEETWGSQFDGDPAAIDAIRRAPGYLAYVRALRSILTFPLTLYRVTTASNYSTWKVSNYSKPVATTFCVNAARVIREVYPNPGDQMILVTGIVSDPEAVIMRGRVEHYELVIDSGRARPVDVKLLSDDAVA